MRPKLLKMVAFGPYSHEQIIDFTQLDNANMFLIYGPTGSGKTTILDGICYALYGETNGGERSGENMRSKFAEEGAVTEVSLYFELHGEMYYIVRRPQYERAPKKGKSTRLIKVPSEVELYKQEGDEYKIISSKYNEVNEKITELLHFNIGQFRQVIMIAQNKFRELLTVSSKERQQILQDIFETGIYQNIEKSLDNLASSAREGLHDQEIIYENILNNIEAEGNEKLHDYLQTKVIYNAPEVCSLLEASCETKHEEMETVTQKLNVLSTEINKAQEVLSKLSQQYEDVQAKAQVETKLKALEEKAESYSDLQKRVALAEKASSILPLEDMVIKLKDEVLVVKKQKEDNEEALKGLTAQLTTQEAHLQTQEKVVSEVEGLKKEYSILETYIPKVKELSTAYDESERLNKVLEKAQAKYEAILQGLEKLKLSISQKEEALKAKEAINKALTEDRLIKKDLEEVLKLKAEREAKAKELQRALQKLEQLYLQTQEANEKHTTSETKYRQAFMVWMNNQAAELAKGLEDNTPCPVCGSLHHPQKATFTEAHMTKEQLEVLENEQKALGVSLNDLQQQCKGQEAQCKMLREILESYDEKLQDKEAVTVEVKNTLEAKIQEQEGKLYQLEAMSQSLEAEKAQFKDYEARKEEGSQFITKTSLTHQEKLTYIQTIEVEVPEALRHLEALEEKLRQLKMAYETKERDYKRLVEEVDTLNKLVTQKTAMLEALEKQLHNLMSQGSERKKLLQEALEKAGFIDMASYKASKLSDEEIKAHKEAIESYMNEQLLLSSKCKELAEKTKDFKVENLEAAKLRYEEVFNSNTQLSVAKNKLEQYLVTHEKIIMQLKALYEDTLKLLKRQSILDKISSLAKGKNSKGLSFERYIQSSIFEEVLASANKKLRPMTLNRYELYRTDDLSRANAQVGLDIGIYDHYNNETRPVSTLSGGESFMAALALALGLSEVIQRLAGATPLDTLFIDEGFGSLDEEALEMAIKTLLSIQDTGRLIGIISHVRELKEQIPVGLEVTTNAKGSQAVFRL